MGKRYAIKIGNTAVFVEDLRLTHGMVIGQNGTRIYPGICQHCGKTNIRYLAHVQQDLTDTMARATGDATEHGASITQDDETFCKDSAAFCDGKTHKEIEVGCVCVGKYLVDCGVDQGLAKRMQEEVSKVMHILQRIAQIEAAKSHSHISKAITTYETTVVLRERSCAINKVPYWKEPTLKEKAAQDAYFSLRYRAHKDYLEAAARWKRENFNYNTPFWASGAMDSTKLEAHFNWCVSREKAKLKRYQTGAQYVTE